MCVSTEDDCLHVSGCEGVRVSLRERAHGCVCLGVSTEGAFVSLVRGQRGVSVYLSAGVCLSRKRVPCEGVFVCV